MKNLLPEELHPVRLYRMVENHKDILEAETILPLDPVVSRSGSNTEHISWLIDQEAKLMVPKLPSYWQVTPHNVKDHTCTEQITQLPCSGWRGTQCLNILKISTVISNIYLFY